MKEINMKKNYVDVCVNLFVWSVWNVCAHVCFCGYFVIYEYACVKSGSLKLIW